MSNWPSKRKKSGRSHIAKVGMIGMGDKSGTGKKLSSGKIRAKGKQELNKLMDEIEEKDIPEKDKHHMYGSLFRNILNFKTML